MLTASADKTVVVTGASGGMGHAACDHLLRQGWHVIGVDHNLDRMQAQARNQANFHPIVMDLTDPFLTQRVLDTVQTLPPLKGLVNLAAISHGDGIEQLDDEAWEHSFAVNVTPAMRLIRALSPLMRENGGGSIVNVSSPVALVGARKASYSASKSALHGLTLSCARSLGPANIRVNLLLPGPTITFMTNDWSAARQESIAEGSFLKRLCHPLEVAKVLAFLLSDDSSYMTGSTIDMTAGTMFGH
ncbi:SDR family NAD(P)-dependent oxidoreductase [Candidatus Methylomicrobium oryzae]|uniref:SDR family NAD(P)-dependent oxidoreductase n=1 Tax=Candidatus Methylomicrobium oryzae TaxID=2802053 RepID=UPI00192242F1|nr:SDR family oxidoreductase [Methylomicrobium sp. RS1]MBL1266009.1 SDR family oxidoreductase [Methylomicrobium sp. RS1]